MYPKPACRINYAVNPGDQMTSEVKWAGGNKFTITLVNSSAGWTFNDDSDQQGAAQLCRMDRGGPVVG